MMIEVTKLSLTKVMKLMNDLRKKKKAPHLMSQAGKHFIVYRK